MINNCGVYQITNKITGDFYIGSSSNIQARRRKHRWELRNGVHGNEHLQRAWNKYGEDAFVFETILLCDPENKLYYEQVLLDGMKPIYNIAKDAVTSMQGLQRSDGTKRKIGDAQRGELHWNFGKHTPDETRAKISESLKGELNPNFGKCFSDETRCKLSESRKGKPSGMLGKHHSDETKRKVGEASKGRVVTKETRAKISESHKGELHWNFGKHPSEETRAKMSEATTAYYAKRKAEAELNA